MTKSYIPIALRRIVSERSRYRCAYCQSAEKIVGSSFTIDHIIPEALGGMTVETNLCLACWPCNLSKGTRIVGLDTKTQTIVRLFHPLKESWAEHFRWENDGVLIVGMTPTGRATVDTLNLNRAPLMKARRLWIEAGWHPPEIE